MVLESSLDPPGRFCTVVSSRISGDAVTLSIAMAGKGGLGRIMRWVRSQSEAVRQLRKSPVWPIEGGSTMTNGSLNYQIADRLRPHSGSASCQHCPRNLNFRSTFDFQ
jgi:hypothetical protein